MTTETLTSHSAPPSPPLSVPPNSPQRWLPWAASAVLFLIITGTAGAITYRSEQQTIIEEPAPTITTTVPVVADSPIGKHEVTLDFFVWEDDLRQVGETTVTLKTQEEGEWDDEPIPPVIGAGNQIYVANPREVFALDLTAGTKQSVYHELAEGYFIHLKSFLDHSGFYGVKTFVPPDDGGYGKQGIISVTNNDPKTAQNLYTGHPGVYTGVDAIGQTNDGGTLYHMNGGEGCGGWGTIYLRQAGEAASKTPVVITKTGESCVEEPRFIGFSQAGNSVILYTVKNAERPKEGEEWPSTVDTIIAINVTTKQRSIIYDIDDITEHENVLLALNKEGDKLAIIRPDKISLIAVPSGNRTQEYSLANPLDITRLSVFSFEQNKILAQYYRDEKDPLVINLLPDHVEVRQLPATAKGIPTHFVGVRDDGSILVYRVR